MKKVELGGRKFTLRNEDEVTYGAEKRVNHERNVAELAMLSNEDIKKHLSTNNGEGKETEKLSNKAVMAMLEDIKKSLVDAQDAALQPEEEVIMLSANLSRAEISDLPGKVVKELAKAADEELGGLLNFTETSTSDTT